MNELQKRFEEETETKFDLNGQDQLQWLNYTRWLENQLIWKSMNEVPEDGVEVWIVNSRYKGAGRIEENEWYTNFGEEINPPNNWMPLSKENL